MEKPIGLKVALSHISAASSIQKYLLEDLITTITTTAASGDNTGSVNISSNYKSNSGKDVITIEKLNKVLIDIMNLSVFINKQSVLMNKKSERIKRYSISCQTENVYRSSDNHKDVVSSDPIKNDGVVAAKQLRVTKNSKDDHNDDINGGFHGGCDNINNSVCSGYDGQMIACNGDNYGEHNSRDISSLFESNSILHNENIDENSHMNTPIASVNPMVTTNGFDRLLNKMLSPPTKKISKVVRTSRNDDKNLSVTFNLSRPPSPIALDKKFAIECTVDSLVPTLHKQEAEHSLSDDDEDSQVFQMLTSVEDWTRLREFLAKEKDMNDSNFCSPIKAAEPPTPAPEDALSEYLEESLTDRNDSKTKNNSNCNNNGIDFSSIQSINLRTPTRIRGRRVIDIADIDKRSSHEKKQSSPEYSAGNDFPLFTPKRSNFEEDVDTDNIKFRPKVLEKDVLATPLTTNWLKHISPKPKVTLTPSNKLDLRKVKIICLHSIDIIHISCSILHRNIFFN